MERLSVISGIDDVELDAIRQTLDVVETVVGLDDLVAVFRRCCERGDRAEILDAIGHSRSPGFLVMGDWTIDDSPQTMASFSELLRPGLQQLGVRTIRLLGCSTAASERARNALQRIAQVTGCRVQGTKCYISRRDYLRYGFVREETLLDSEGLSLVAR